jgi:hypothetical protein
MVENNNQYAYPMQRQLFQKLKKKYKAKGQDWVNSYMFESKLSKTPAYNRMSGNTPISFDEGLSLIHKEGLNMIDWQIPLQNHTDDELLKDCHMLQNAIHPKIILSIQDLPLIYIKMNRLLAGFKLYCAQRFSTCPSKYAKQPFSKIWLDQDDVYRRLNAKRTVLDQFIQLPRTDIWTLGMFDKLILSIKYVDAIKGFQSPVLKDEIIAAIYQIVDKLREIASDTTGHVQVFENQFFSIGNQLLMQSSEVNAMYIWSDVDTKIKLTSAPLIESYQNTLENMLSRARLINPRSEYDFINFFSQLEERIKQML